MRRKSSLVIFTIFALRPHKRLAVECQLGDTDHAVSVPVLYPLNDSVTSLRYHLLISPVINLDASVPFREAFELGRHE